jgi:phosphoribosylglycinamide formyltransferase-1
MKSIVILISGRGSNLQAIAEAGLPARISAVLSNRPDAKGLEYARNRQIPAAIVDHRNHATRESFDTALAAAIDEFDPQLVVLAGFMRILTPQFVERYAGRMVNIHPSLLPAFPGVDTHRRVLEAGVKLHGCTVHFVAPEVDRGPIIAQAAVPVLATDDEAALAARVLTQEHLIYPRAVRWFLEERLLVDNGVVRLRGNAEPQSSYAAG